MAKLKDLIGQHFGKLTVLDRADDHVSKNGSSRTAWLCRCECGNELVVMGLNLTRGHTTSCGCARKDGRKKLMIDITGQRFGNLTAIRHVENNKKNTYWLFRCDCGTEKEMLLQNVKSGKSTSCGKCKTVLNATVHTQRGIVGNSYDLTGQRFDKLVAVKRFVDDNKVKYICKCDCGNTCVKTTSSLKYGTKYVGSNSCGCLQKNSVKKTKSLIGQRFNYLVVIGEADSKYGKLHWLCRCDCGNETIVSSSGLLSGHTKSCGCYQDAVASNTHFEDLAGMKIGLLTVLKRVEDSSRGDVRYLCQCECGNKKIIRGTPLKDGRTLSCGCYSQSFGEQYIDDILFNIGLNYDTQVKFKDLTGLSGGVLSYDFSIEDGDELLGLIEYQGEQHFKPVDIFGGQLQFEKQQLHDDLKREYAKNYLNVPLLEIPYTKRTVKEIYDLIVDFCHDNNIIISEYDINSPTYQILRKYQKKVYCIELDRIFNSIREAMLFCNLKSTNSILKSCDDNKYTAGGYHWIYVDN